MAQVAHAPVRPEAAQRMRSLVLRGVIVDQHLEAVDVLSKRALDRVAQEARAVAGRDADADARGDYAAGSCLRKILFSTTSS
jgi:hypothetical protein